MANNAPLVSSDWPSTVANVEGNNRLVSKLSGEADGICSLFSRTADRRKGGEEGGMSGGNTLIACSSPLPCHNSAAVLWGTDRGKEPTVTASLMVSPVWHVSPGCGPHPHSDATGLMFWCMLWWVLNSQEVGGWFPEYFGTSKHVKWQRMVISTTHFLDSLCIEFMGLYYYHHHLWTFLILHIFVEWCYTFCCFIC